MALATLNGAPVLACNVSIPAWGVWTADVEIGSTEAPTPSRERFRDGAARARWDMRARRRHGARMRSSGRLFNEWLEKSRADLALLTTRMETGRSAGCLARQRATSARKASGGSGLPATGGGISSCTRAGETSG